MRFADRALERSFLRAYLIDAVPMCRWGVILSAVMALAFMWQDTEISEDGIYATYIRVGLIMPLCALSWFAMRRPGAHKWIQVIISVFLLLYSACTAAIFVVFEPTIYGISGAIAEGNFVMIMLAAFTITCLRLWWAMSVGVGIIAIYALAVSQWGAGDYTEFMLTHLSNIVMAFCLGALTCGMFESLRRRQFLTLSLLDNEKERYKNLLCTLVPPAIASRIERGETPIADSHSDIAVLFSDFVGFTTLTSRVAPHRLVQLLNDLFSEFDAAAERHGIEKIKTIGDGYMAACGAPVSESMRTITLVKFGLELVAITEHISEKHGIPVGVRVGVHSGSLIAGVIGKSRFAYDMWGETVNMASRMESSGVPGRVQVSESAFQRLRGHFAVEARENVQIKGGGEVATYLIKELATQRD
ncbi:adenylate/guanylate cyclase domain-containing protein [Massilia sp. BSC265]|uniref:adenylate/guanylate cyclase domain-containing protein n=1 Tax=Massilia sp. BSC265 TaxID=1549812 RepID=UPI00068D79B7|nr:adenylate/guanylate cyclase domain-containing protein [Massilia sp. BSC265]